MAKSLMGGNSVNLVGELPAVGTQAPDFSVVDAELKPKSLADFPGKKILNVVPSLDTPVCDEQTRRFEAEVDKLGGFTVLTISVDLPFAQKRWCSAAKVSKVKLLSDYQERSFGKAYGVLIKELQLLNRAVFILDANNRVRYVQKVEENFNHPNYDEILAAAKNI